jgi:hypothetical protein
MVNLADISNIEHGRLAPVTLQKLSAALGVDLHQTQRRGVNENADHDPGHSEHLDSALVPTWVAAIVREISVQTEAADGT